MIKKNHITPSFIGALIITLVIGVIVAGNFYFLFFEKPWLRYMNIPFPALATYGKPGHAMPIHIKRCNDDSMPHVYSIASSFERVTKPGETRDAMTLQSVMVQIMPGCSEADSIVHTIPLDTPPGIWRVVGVSEVQGVLRSHLVEWYSVPFEVRDK